LPSPATGLLGLLLRVPAFGGLQYREFRLLLAAQFGNSMGIWMDQVARGWLLYDLTGSTVDLGLVSAVKVLPLLLLSPVAGTMADRYGRKTQLIVAQTLNALANLILGTLVISRRIEPWHVFATGFVVAVVQVFEVPARQAMISETVDRAHLTNAIGLMSMVFNVSRSLGPAVAGGLIAVMGPGGSYLVQALIYAASTQWTVQLRVPDRPPVTSEAGRSFAATTFAGWSYVVHHASIRSVLLVLALVGTFGMSFGTLLPVFARDILQVGSAGQGFMLTAMGIGAIVASFLVASFGETLPKGALIVSAAAVYGLGVMLFAHSTAFPLSMLLMIGIGSANVTSATLTQTVVQGHSSKEMRGRVMGVFQQNQILITLGSVLAGALAATWTSQTALTIMGAILSASALGILFANPQIRRIR